MSRYDSPHLFTRLFGATILFVVIAEIGDCDVTTSEPQLCPNTNFDCELLQPGQYYCADPVIDPVTQREEGCLESRSFVEVDCYPVAGICCSGHLHNGQTIGFRRKMPCKWTGGKKFSVALLLSIFVGWLGIDRFYLGYVALGMLKFCTFGFMLIWTLVDILLIALQIVGPADGSEYIIDYYGPGLTRIVADNLTYIVPPGADV
jgi:TM2 domain-containing membrane protein YozV